MTNSLQKLGRLKKRAEFLFVANRSQGRNHGRYQARPSVVIQMRKNETRDIGIHVGFTATKRIGNAVVRNRAKRRLRACARALLPQKGKPGHDYVFIARAATPTVPNSDLVNDVEKALSRLV